MSNSGYAKRRLMNELKKVQDELPSGTFAAPDENNIFRWNAVICGPEDTPFEYGVFTFTMHFPNDYPMTAPMVNFNPPIFHPNVFSEDGSVCLDILQSDWMPYYSVSSVVISAQALLSSPNPDWPANAEAATLYATNRAEYDRRVRQCVNACWEQEERQQTAEKK